jgi:hypothetical protein
MIVRRCCPVLWVHASAVTADVDAVLAALHSPDSLGGWRDPSNMLRVLSEVRDSAGTRHELSRRRNGVQVE